LRLHFSRLAFAGFAAGFLRFFFAHFLPVAGVVFAGPAGGFAPGGWYSKAP
jgi:hypothetical protein